MKREILSVAAVASAYISIELAEQYIPVEALSFMSVLAVALVFRECWRLKVDKGGNAG